MIPHMARCKTPPSTAAIESRKEDFGRQHFLGTYQKHDRAFLHFKP